MRRTESPIKYESSLALENSVAILAPLPRSKQVAAGGRSHAARVLGDWRGPVAGACGPCLFADAATTTTTTTTRVAQVMAWVSRPQTSPHARARRGEAGPPRGWGAGGDAVASRTGQRAAAATAAAAAAAAAAANRRLGRATKKDENERDRQDFHVVEAKQGHLHDQQTPAPRAGDKDKEPTLPFSSPPRRHGRHRRASPSS